MTLKPSFALLIYRDVFTSNLKHFYISSESFSLSFLSFLVNLESFVKDMGKLCKLRKNCNHKQNINVTYIGQLHCNCLQQLPNLRLKTEDPRKLGNLGERNGMLSCNLVLSLVAKN